MQNTYYDFCLFASRINFDVSCPMQFDTYPHDIQECDINFESYDYTKKEQVDNKSN